MKIRRSEFVDVCEVPLVGEVTYSAEIAEEVGARYHLYGEEIFVGVLSKIIIGYSGKLNLDKPSEDFFNSLEGSLRCETHLPKNFPVVSNIYIEPSTPEFQSVRKHYFNFLEDVMKLYK